MQFIMTNKYTIFGFFLPFAYMLCCDICMTNSGTRRPLDFKESKNVDPTTFLANLKENFRFLSLQQNQHSSRKIGRIMKIVIQCALCPDAWIWQPWILSLLCYNHNYHLGMKITLFRKLWLCRGRKSPGPQYDIYFSGTSDQMLFFRKPMIII